MPKKVEPLSALEVRGLRESRGAGLHAVGGVAGLQLQVTESGAQSWILRVKVGSLRRDMGLGGFPDVTLAQARERARLARDEINAGRDPILERDRMRSQLAAEQAAGKTFAQVQRLFLEAKSDEWRNAKHRAQWAATLNTYAAPTIGALLVADIEQSHIETILAPIWRTKTETASRVRGRIERVIDYATAKGWRKGDNPARWRGLLETTHATPAKIAKVKHRPALPIDELPAFVKALRKREGMAARALEFAILTAARPGEVRGATWSEIDLDAAVWTIPGARMKAGKTHRVPLSKQALRLLRATAQVEDSPFLFPAPRLGALSDMAMTKVTRTMKIAAVPHGMRSTFKDWASERTAYANEISEAALAHTIPGKTEAAYRRGDLFDKRRRLMAEWAAFLDSPQTTAKVLPLRRASKR